MSDTRPQTPTLARVIDDAMNSRISGIHVAIPGRVESYDASKQAVSVQPLIRREFQDEEDQRQIEGLPVINDVPVVFPGGGGFRVTFPIAAGDTVLLVFSESSIDKWLTRGGEVDPIDERKHALSDAIAIPGLRDFANSLSDASADFMTMGQNDGPQIEIDDSEIRAGGAAIAALKSDVDGLAGHVDTHVHTGGTIFGLTGTPTGSSPAAVGADKLRG